jgi:hypothetical protein
MSKEVRSDLFEMLNDIKDRWQMEPPMRRKIDDLIR